jgi:integrase
MLLRQCLDQAVNEDKILFNPADRCKLPPKTKPEMKIIPPEFIGKYLKAAEDINFLPMFFLELSVGLRRGELVALLWEDLDIKNKTISVSKQLSGGKYVTTPKTPNSTRVVPIPEHAVKLLKEEHSKHPDNPYMFPSPVTGSMYYPDSVSRIHKRILRRAGLEVVRFHDLRHTFAALALQNGVDVKTLSHILFHYSAGFTLDTYGHVTDKMRRDAAKKISKFFSDVMGE